MPGITTGGNKQTKTTSKTKTTTVKKNSKTSPKKPISSNTSQRKCTKKSHKGGDDTHIRISDTITNEISTIFQQLIPSFLQKGSKSFVSKFEAKHVADKGFDTKATAHFQFVVNHSYNNILIDFQNLFIDEKFRGKGILGNVFNRIEEMVHNYSNDPKCEKPIIVRVSDFNNFLLGCHFVLQRGYDLYNPYKPQETNKPKMQTQKNPSYPTN